MSQAPNDARNPQQLENTHSSQTMAGCMGERGKGDSMRPALLIWGGCLAIAIFGCDQRPAAPVSAVPTQPPPVVVPEEARPTTQELLIGARKPLQLPNMPLSVRVPVSWKIEPTGPLTVLTGPTPFDKAMIQLA